MSAIKSVWGNDCDFRVNVNGTMTSLVCAQNFKMNIETESVEIAARTNGTFKDFDYQAIEYSLTFQGAIKIPSEDDGLNTVFDVMLAQKAFVDFNYEMWFTEGVTGAVQILSGRVIVKTVELSAGKDQWGGFSLEMQGCGEYFLRDTICDAHIDGASGTRATYDGSGFDVFHVHLSQISQETQIITYSINDAPETQIDYVTGTSTFDFDVSVPHAGVATLTIAAKCNESTNGIINNYTIDPTKATF